MDSVVADSRPAMGLANADGTGTAQTPVRPLSPGPTRAGKLAPLPSTIQKRRSAPTPSSLHAHRLHAWADRLLPEQEPIDEAEDVGGRPVKYRLYCTGVCRCTASRAHWGRGRGPG